MTSFAPLFVPRCCRLSPFAKVLYMIPGLSVFVSIDFEKMATKTNEMIRGQLLQRAFFPHGDWTEAAERGAFCNDPEEICKIIAREFQWPNHFFLPEDESGLLTTQETGNEPRWANGQNEFYFNAYEFGGQLEEVIRRLLPKTFDTHPGTPDPYDPDIMYG